jgi:hypothetical protein
VPAAGSLRRPESCRRRVSGGHRGRHLVGHPDLTQNIGQNRPLREGRPQIKRRVKGEPITDRIVSLSDPDSRPIRKGELGKPNEFGYVTQLAKVTENKGAERAGRSCRRRARRATPDENTLLPHTVAELRRLGISPREVALDGGFQPGPTNDALGELRPERTFIAGRQPPDSKRAGGGCGATAAARRVASATTSAATASAAAGPSAPRPADLDRLGNPRLQPRHPRRPKHRDPLPSPLQTTRPFTRRPRHHPGAAFQRPECIRGK